MTLIVAVSKLPQLALPLLPLSPHSVPSGNRRYPLRLSSSPIKVPLSCCRILKHRSLADICICCWEFEEVVFIRMHYFVLLLFTYSYKSFSRSMPIVRFQATTSSFRDVLREGI
ncbi:hypothetical protein GGR54DRAFT_413683 [Hypoxylon sp. NC1633]|nr:hypothetical protein GGR54DRAFT_413683 [Hypoxylon sp. NC1633]